MSSSGHYREFYGIVASHQQLIDFNVATFSLCVELSGAKGGDDVAMVRC